MKVSLEAVAREQLAAAQRASSHRAARAVVGGHERALRQTVIALLAGCEMAEHENPGESTLYVVSGRVELRSGADTWQARRGDLLEIPRARHSLAATEDSVVLLTTCLTG